MSEDLIVVGNISLDNISYCGISKGSFWGGAGSYISASAAILGIRPKLISVVGRDALPLLAKMEDWVDISPIRVLGEKKTCYFDMRYSENGTLLDINCDFGAASSLSSYLQEVDLPLGHYHVSCRHPIDPKKIIYRIYEKGFSFSLDFILSSAWQQMAKTAVWLQHAKYIFVNSQELEILWDIKNISSIHTLIVTSGSQPVRVFKFGHEVLRQDCSTVKFCDVTGAGDVLIGAFLASQLRGDDLQESLDKAICLAQKSLRSTGVLQFFYRNNTAQQGLPPDAACAAG